MNGNNETIFSGPSVRSFVQRCCLVGNEAVGIAGIMCLFPSRHESIDLGTLGKQEHMAVDDH